MKISEMIHRLELLKADHGDINVMHSDADLCYDFEPVIELHDHHTAAEDHRLVRVPGTVVLITR